MNTKQRREVVEKTIGLSNGVLRLDPAWVARVFIPPGKRLGLDESNYHLGPRGGVCERWLASTTSADNPVRIPEEGLSKIQLASGERMTLKEAVEIAGPSILGGRHARTHRTLDRLAKIFDYADRLPFHLHQMKKHAALVGRRPKEEAYYFPAGAPPGPHPESFLGVHPSVAEPRNRELLLPHLVEWNSDRILQHSKAYQLLPDDGFHIPSGTLHAPGSALTIELQEDSDVFAMMQARVGNTLISKELLFKDVRPADRRRYGERIILDMVDWRTSGDPFFFENRHTPPIPVKGGAQPGGDEYWIFYNTRRFSGKRLVVRPGQTYRSRDAGVYNILVWRGEGTVDGHAVKGGDPALDELLVCHDKAVAAIDVKNTGTIELEIFKFFGPDVNADVPMLKRKKSP